MLEDTEPLVQVGMSQSSYSPRPVKHQGDASSSGLRHLLFPLIPPSLAQQGVVTNMCSRGGGIVTSLSAPRQTTLQSPESPRIRTGLHT